MRIDTDIVLWNGNDRKKYRVVITVEAWADEPIIGGKENRKVENHSTLQTLLKEFICQSNKKAQEEYLSKLQSDNPTQLSATHNKNCPSLKGKPICTCGGRAA